MLAAFIAPVLVAWGLWVMFLVTSIGDRSLGRPPLRWEAAVLTATILVPPLLCWLIEYNLRAP